MARLKIEEMKLPEDKNEINQWHIKYKNNKNYENIKQFILEYIEFLDLAEVIFVNHEILDTDFREEKKALAVKNNKNETIGFILCDAYDMTDYSSMLYLQYIVIKPTLKNKGYGSEIFTEFFNNIKHYIGFEPTDIYASIHRYNKESIALFKKFGFDFSKRSRSYLRADADLYTIKNIINQKTFE